MNQEVPQPMTQTSSPAAGSTPSSSAASSAARSHSAGCVLISCAVTLTSARITV